MASITAKQALEQSTAWLDGESGMSATADGGIVVDGNPPLTINLTADEDRLLLTHEVEERGGGAARADAVMAMIPDRGTMMRVGASVSKKHIAFTFTNTVYLDGFSRQAVVAAANELVSTIDGIGMSPEAATMVQPAVPTTVVAPDEPDPSTDATETAEVEAVASGWKPTHRVPAGGMRAWDEPDPATQAASRLEARVELQVVERRGDWARVVGTNGWTGWVDARKLEDLGPGSSSDGVIDLGGFKLRTLPLLAVAGLVLAAFLPWVDVGGSTANSFEVALSFLWDLTAAGSPYLGLVIIGLAVLALFVAGASKPNPGLTTLLGIGSVALASLFVVQMYRGVADGGGTFSDVMDILGLAPWVMLGSGVVLLAAARK